MRLPASHHHTGTALGRDQRQKQSWSRGQPPLAPDKQLHLFLPQPYPAFFFFLQPSSSSSLPASCLPRERYRKKFSFYLKRRKWLLLSSASSQSFCQDNTGRKRQEEGQKLLLAELLLLLSQFWDRLSGETGRPFCTSWEKGEGLFLFFFLFFLFCSSLA